MAESLFPTRWKKDKPPSIERFMEMFPDDHACAAHLARRRWPGGFACPHCGSTKGWQLASRPWVWECAGMGEAKGCRKQTSVISGTVMHGTHVPLRKWFVAAYLMATHSNSISALQLQAKIGVGSYETAWLMLQKLRRAMVAPGRTPLAGVVEIDETSIAYRKKDDPKDGGQGKSTVGKRFIVGGVELVGKNKAGRIRLQHIEEDKAKFILPFVEAHTAAGSIVVTDANPSYRGLEGRRHVPKNLSALNALPAHITLGRIHRVFSNLKRWGMGTFHGFREKHIDAYLNEFVFRWNRRRRFSTAMDTMLGIGQSVPRATYRDIVGDTSEWREQHREQILKMVSPDRLAAARAVRRGRMTLVQALDDILPVERKYQRKKPKHPVLGAPAAAATPAEPAPVDHSRPFRPSRREVELGWARHIPPAARSRRIRRTSAVARG